MQEARKSSLMLNLKLSAATACAAFVTIAAPFNASAHVLPGSPLEKSTGFVNAMTRINPDGSKGMSCCHKEDAQGPVEEKPIRDSNDRIIGYKVKIVNDEYGHPLDHPVWRNVPQEAILRYPDAVKFCKDLKEKSPDSPDVATCKVPTINALWTSTIPHKPSDDPDATDFTIYCYLPKPPKF